MDHYNELLQVKAATSRKGYISIHLSRNEDTCNLFKVIQYNTFFFKFKISFNLSLTGMSDVTLLIIFGICLFFTTFFQVLGFESIR